MALAAARGTQAGAARRGLRDALAPAATLAGLAAIVGARWLATRSGLDGLAVGAAFGLGLAVLWLVARRRASATAFGAGGAGTPLALRPVTRGLPTATVIGLGFGLALAVGAVAGTSIGGFPLVPGLGRPAAPFLPWAAITVVVAAAEEGILRGVLFDRLRASSGLVVAMVITTIAFALMHVPLYGWHVVPLDVAVGLAFAGLRLSTGSIAAPVAAHVLADLASWWL